MIEKNQKDSLSRRDHLRLEEYRTHNLWNDHDGKNMMLMDAILGAVAAALLFRNPEILNTPLLKGVATFFLALMLIMWGLLYCKFSKRMDFRYNTMRAIEGKLGFRAHKDIKEYIDTHRFLQKYVKFYWVRVGYSVVLFIFALLSLWGEGLCTWFDVFCTC